MRIRVIHVVNSILGKHFKSGNLNSDFANFQLLRKIMPVFLKWYLSN